MKQLGGANTARPTSGHSSAPSSQVLTLIKKNVFQALDIPLQPMEDHSGAGELCFIERTHAGAVHEGLSPMIGTHEAQDNSVRRKKQQRQFSSC